MTSLLEPIWHAPAGYRAVRTTTRLRTLSVEFLSESRANTAAADLNDRRQPYAQHEWVAVQHGKRWRIVAFELRLEAIDL